MNVRFYKIFHNSKQKKFQILELQNSDEVPHFEMKINVSSKKMHYFNAFVIFSSLLCVTVFILCVSYISNVMNLFNAKINGFSYSLDDLKRALIFIDENNSETFISRKSKILHVHKDQAPVYESCLANVPDSLRFDCHPEEGASKETCESRGCCWKPLIKDCEQNQVPLNIPYCYYPENWQIYKFQNWLSFENEFYGSLRLQRNSSYGKDLSVVMIEATGIDDTTLRVKMYDPNNKRYEPPFPVRDNLQQPIKASNVQYRFITDNTNNLPGFNVKRVADKTTLFKSIGVGGFIFADQFLQISSILPSKNIYGLGEHQANLKLSTDWQTFIFLNADQPPRENLSLYGSHPFYLVIEESGNCHGVLFLNSNAMNVILQPTPAITFRTIGGIFDIYFFMGPKPEDVLKQYANIVGKPFLLPYWSLGFHLSKYGLRTLNSTRELWKKMREAKIPYDTQWNDLDYMDKNNDFTYDPVKFKDLPKFVDELHDAGMHYIPLIDAGVSASEKNGTYLPYDVGLREGIFVADGDLNEPFKGKVWNLVSTVWPDFTNPKSANYYYEMMKYMYKSFQFDGAWIDMNEPSNFYDGTFKGCKKNELDFPPYLPKVNDHLLSKKTLCMNARHYLGSHYNLHNTYGTSQAAVVNYALTKIRQKRPFIISRSTWVGHGFYAGHWSGDVFSEWHDMRMSIPEILTMGFYQIPMIGADICGFNGNTTKALCNRWMQLGAFYPFSRNHNSDDTIDQDPVTMGDLVIQSSKKALKIRYYLLPYLYTLFVRAHLFAETVARPLFFEFINDPKTYDIDTHFLWGKYLLIIPILEENAVSVTAYIPRGFWYDFYTKQSKFSIGIKRDFDAPLDTIPLLVRGGAILPVQEPELTTTESRKNPFGLLITLNHENKASGELYWDDGDSLDSIKSKKYQWIKFNVENSSLRSLNEEHVLFNEQMRLERIEVWGIKDTVTCVTVANKHVNFQYDDKKKVLVVQNLKINLKINFIMNWACTNSPTEQKVEQIVFLYASSSASKKFDLLFTFVFVALVIVKT